MSNLTKHKAANALVWAAFFAFWFHSLRCCQAHSSSERCVFELTRPRSNNDSPNQVCDKFHYVNRFSTCRRFPLCSTSRFERREPSEAPAFDRNRDAEKPTCSGACPPSRIAPGKKIFGDFDALPTRTLADIFAKDVRLVPASTYLTRLFATFSTPLYLRLSKLLN